MIPCPMPSGIVSFDLDCTLWELIYMEIGVKLRILLPSSHPSAFFAITDGVLVLALGAELDAVEQILELHHLYGCHVRIAARF